MEKLNLLKAICDQFEMSGTIGSVKPITSGHINDTFLVSTTTIDYVLQKLNTDVFINWKAVIENKIVVSNHLKNIYNNKYSDYNTVEFIKTNSNSFYLEKDNTIWMMMQFIKDSQTFVKAIDENLVFEAGLLYGDFIANSQTLDSSKIVETLPDFHSVPLRLKQFEFALNTASEERKQQATAWIDLVQYHGNNMCELWELKSKGVLPMRITHNDTKLSNILFSNSNPIRGLAVIDLDTVMPGLVHFDFGDSVRSICSNTTEDDNELKNATINLDFYKAYCNGFAEKTKPLLSNLEIQYLPLGAQSIIFIMGLRFLTDFLNNDIYYKTNYELHNLVRASNQFSLFKSVLDNIESIKSITYKAFALNDIT
jgi:thiamine kinase-like enzyme